MVDLNKISKLNGVARIEKTYKQTAEYMYVIPKNVFLHCD